MGKLVQNNGDNPMLLGAVRCPKNMEARVIPTLPMALCTVRRFYDAKQAALFTAKPGQTPTLHHFGARMKGNNKFLGVE